MRREKPIEVLDDDDVELLLGAMPITSNTWVRNRAIVAVFYYAGLRCAEALALRPRDVDLDRGEIVVRRGKGAKQRLATISPPGIPHVQLWLERRAQMGLPGKAPVLCTISTGDKRTAGGELVEPYVWKMLQRAAERAGIEKRVHPHGLRHSHAARLARRGVPMNYIQGQLGHASLATTSMYLDSVAPEARSGAISAAG